MQLFAFSRKPSSLYPVRRIICCKSSAKKKFTIGNSVKNDKEIQLNLGLVGLLLKVGLLGPLRSGPKSRDTICFQIRHVTRSPNLKSDLGLGLRFRSYSRLKKLNKWVFGNKNKAISNQRRWCYTQVFTQNSELQSFLL